MSAPSKTALVTGASTGIGKAVSLALLGAGYAVALTGRRKEPLDATAQEAPAGARTLVFPADVSDPAQVKALFAKIKETFGRLDVLVNNAGYSDICSIEDTSLDEFRAQIETNLFGVINVTKAALPVMREQGTGHILQFSSVGGRIGPVGRAPYAAAKWGVEGFSEVLFKEVGPLGVKVTIIEPGGFRTDFAGSSAAIREGRPEYDATVGKTAQFQRDYNGKQPGDPAKAAAAVLHIASLNDPPLRLLLGSDAVRFVEQNDLAKMESDRKWKDLSISTDIEQVTEER